MREKTIYEKIAEKYNTTPEEVRREMQIAIDAGFDDPDPAVQAEWKKVNLKGDRPTPEEVINYRATARTPASPSSASSWATAPAGSCTKTPKCRTTAIRAAAPVSSPA